MLFKLNAFGIILILVSILSLYFTFYSLRKREDKVYYYFGLLSFFCFIDFIFQGLECIFNPFNIQYLFAHACTLGYIFISSIWLLLSYSLVTVNKDLSKKWKILLFTLPVIFAILVITNPLTHWVYDLSFPSASAVYKLQLVVEPHLGYNLIVFYNFFCAAITILIIFYGLIKGSRIFRKTYLILLFTSILEIFINLLAFTPLYPGFSFGVTSYMISIIFLYISVFVYEKFDLISIVNDNVINDIDVGILYFNKNNYLLTVNPSSSLINVTEKDLEKDVKTIFRNQEDILNFYNGDSKIIQLQFNDRWVEIKKSLMFDKDVYLGQIFTVTDVSDDVYKLEQKDMLVKEVNHRVKNNLQIILSLINLDIRFHPDDPLSIINDTRSRLTYMSNLHDKLYSSSSMDKVDIKDYLPDISRSLIQMYDSDIQVFEDMDSYSIDLDFAVSLGLILTEIINNMVKYAFEDGNNNKFFIEFKINGNTGVLDLFDNGKGLPDGFDFESSTGLGMTVIKSLTQQINGEVSIVSDDGAHFRIKFPLN